MDESGNTTDPILHPEDVVCIGAKGRGNYIVSIVQLNLEAQCTEPARTLRRGGGLRKKKKCSFYPLLLYVLLVCKFLTLNVILVSATFFPL